MPTVAAGIGSELQPVRVRGDLDLRRNEIRSGRWGRGPRSVSSGSPALSSSRCF